MYGMIFSLKNFVTKISPYDLKQGFLCYRTNKYALHFMETPTGVKFVLNTDVNALKVRELLQQLYSNVNFNFIPFTFLEISKSYLFLFIDFLISDLC